MSRASRLASRAVATRLARCARSPRSASLDEPATRAPSLPPRFGWAGLGVGVRDGRRRDELEGRPGLAHAWPDGGLFLLPPPARLGGLGVGGGVGVGGLAQPLLGGGGRAVAEDPAALVREPEEEEQRGDEDDGE